jgi:hypothetical protein
VLDQGPDPYLPGESTGGGGGGGNTNKKIWPVPTDKF